MLPFKTRKAVYVQLKVKARDTFLTNFQIRRQCPWWNVVVYCRSGVTGTCWYLVHWLAVIKNVGSFALSLQTIDGKRLQLVGLWIINTDSAHWKIKLSLASLRTALVSYYVEMVLWAWDPHSLVSVVVWQWFMVCQIGLVSRGFFWQPGLYIRLLVA